MEPARDISKCKEESLLVAFDNVAYCKNTVSTSINVMTTVCCAG